MMPGKKEIRKQNGKEKVSSKKNRERWVVCWQGKRGQEKGTEYHNGRRTGGRDQGSASPSNLPKPCLVVASRSIRGVMENVTK